MSRLNCALIALLFCSAAAADTVAPEQRFYQVIDENGRPQTIMISGQAAKSSTEKKDTAAPATDQHQELQPPQASQVQDVIPPAAPPISVIPLAPSAPVPKDNETYLDSEILESTNFNPEKKKHFYVLEDGVGTRIQESDGQLTGVAEHSAPLFPKSKVAGGTILESSLIELTDPVAIQKLMGAHPLCMAQPEKKVTGVLSKGRSASVKVDSKTRQFLGVGSPLLVLRVEDEGLRKLKLTSYSVSERSPSFFMPVIAFADPAGCIIRAHPGGYFERRHEATKMRQHRVEGGFIMLSAEKYLLIVLPEKPQPDQVEPVTLNENGVVAVEYE